MFTDSEAQQLRRLLTEARTVGSKDLLRRLYALKAEGTTTATAAGVVEILVDTLEDLQHGHYRASVQSNTNAAVVDSIEGSGFTPAGAALSGIHFAIVRRRRIGAVAANRKVDVYLSIANTTGVDREVTYQVFRIPGLGA